MLPSVRRIDEDLAGTGELTAVSRKRGSFRKAVENSESLICTYQRRYLEAHIELGLDAYKGNRRRYEIWHRTNGYARCHCCHLPRFLFLIASVSFPHRTPGAKIRLLHGVTHNFLLTQHTLLRSRINPCPPPEFLNNQERNEFHERSQFF